MKIYIVVISLWALLVAPLQAEVMSATVKGMVCSFCAQGITKKFKKMEIIKDVHVDLDHQLVAIELKEGTKLDDKAFASVITKSGFKMEALKHHELNMLKFKESLPKDEEGKSEK